MHVLLTVAAWWMAISLCAVPLWIAFLAKGGSARPVRPPQALSSPREPSSPARRTA